MKHIRKILLTSMILIGLGLGLGSCVGYVDGGRGGYYGHDRWYHDGPWMDGPRGFVGIGIHPVRR